MQKILFATLTLGATLLVANPPMQQNAQPQQGMPPQQQKQPAVEVSDKEAKQFTVALVKIEQLRENFQQEVQSKTPKGERPNPEMVQKANQKFQDKAVSIVKDKGLTLQKYNMYAQLMQTDKAFQQKIQKNLQSMDK